MLNINQLRENMPTIKCTGEDAKFVSLDLIQDMLQGAAEENGIPIAFEQDQVKSGGLLNKTIEDCLIVYHPNHKNDYYKICIRIQEQGTIRFIKTNDFGISKNLDIKQKKSEEERNYYSCLSDIINETL